MRFKTVGFNRYIHVSQLIGGTAPESIQMDLAARVAHLIAERDFNVVKFHGESDRVSLLDYPGFFEEAFPALNRYWVVDISIESVRHRNLSNSGNPPVLHRKELLLQPEHPMVAEFSETTLVAERLGLFDEPARIGLMLDWERRIASAGFQVAGNALVPLGNENQRDIVTNVDCMERDEIEILRHRTALSRTSLSAPLQGLLRLGLLVKDSTVFDYGCGRGGDLERLREAGITANGWDPYFLPDARREAAEIVNLGFVLNVIEEIDERTLALRGAFELAQKVLVVGVMTSISQAAKHPSFRDGVLTSRQTFQKYYRPEEFSDYLETVLGRRAFPIAPGICLVFKCNETEYNFMRGSRRSPGNFRTRRPLSRPRPHRLSKLERLTSFDGEFLRQVVDFWKTHGRPPLEIECPLKTTSSDSTLRSLGQAIRLIPDGLPEAHMEIQFAEQRLRGDLMVTTACHAHLNLSSLTSIPNEDIRYHFGSRSRLVEATRKEIALAGEPASLYAICQETAVIGLGHIDERDRFWISADRVDDLPVALRIFIRLSCASIGDVSMFDLIKLSIRSQKITLLQCEDIQCGPFVGGGVGFKINLRSGTFEEVSLHATALDRLPKSQLIGIGHPLWSAQLAFEEATRDYLSSSDDDQSSPAQTIISRLRASRYSLNGLQVERCNDLPALDEPCGSHFTFRDLVECGETQVRLKVSNVPIQPESYNALADLCVHILDPVIDYFGPVKLTYGLSCSELTKNIRGSIAPKLDQHASFERDKRGKPICSRGGAAADFLVEDEDMEEVVLWIMRNTPFDRLYFYGSRRPVHVSFGPEHSRKAYRMSQSKGGAILPRELKIRP